MCLQHVQKRQLAVSTPPGHNPKRNEKMSEGPSCLVSKELSYSCNEENQLAYNTQRVRDLSANKHPQEGEGEGRSEEELSRNLCKLADDAEEDEKQIKDVSDNISLSKNKKRRVDDSSHINLLFNEISQDISLQCLMRCTRADHPIIASLNSGFRSVIRSGELYKLRRKEGIVEYWVYISCGLSEWEAYDPNEGRWVTLPILPANQCFLCSDKESQAVGTDLLVFGKEIMASVIYKYSILTNSWSHGTSMNFPRCLFASGSLGEIAIVAGGCDAVGNITDIAELYNSETQSWEILPSMKVARKMCAGAFMDGNFYVIGGINKVNTPQLTSGEEFDLKTRTWRCIPDMFPRNGGSVLNFASEAPPLIAVVGNQLYAADYAEEVVRRYIKELNSWVSIGRLPKRVNLTKGWGLAFRACGDQLIVIGAPKVPEGRFIEVYGCVPGDDALEWNLLARRHSGNFVYNCAVMEC
ncbi:F-box/kelch-repeat protein [Senna tora]|uniref:F-box/kelch-repeat protein n=1 Tax=Senna tora TaxID=362788 RepID=A0A835CEG7_9FABA|nr:F-box/kelch-repeat protein [Senna tora]